MKTPFTDWSCPSAFKGTLAILVEGLPGYDLMKRNGRGRGRGSMF